MCLSQSRPPFSCLNSKLLVFTKRSFLSTFSDAKVSTSEVTYKISTNTHRNENFVTPIDASKIKNQVPIIFIIHGWTNYGTKPWIQNLTTALLTHSDCNVVAVDWRKPANDSYPIAVKNVKEVGKYFTILFLFIATTVFC